MPGQLLDTMQLRKVDAAFGPPRIPDIGEFKQLSCELLELMPVRDAKGMLQFRVLHDGEMPLNRFARRLIAQRLVTGQYK